MSEPYLFYLGLASGLVVGAFSAIAAHVLTKRRDLATRDAILDREAEIRRREFSRIITRWRCRLIYSDRADGTVTPRPTFNQAITEIMAEFALCGADFKDRRTKIEEAIRAASAVSDADIDSRVRGQEQKSHGEAFAEDLRKIAASCQE